MDKETPELVNLYPYEDDIFHTEPPERRPKRAIPPHLAREVTLSTGEKATVEIGCGTCEFGPLELNVAPCELCNKNYTDQNPYPEWAFDTEYDPADDIFI